jgi:hypothetical protein
MSINFYVMTISHVDLDINLNTSLPLFVSECTEAKGLATQQQLVSIDPLILAASIIAGDL